ncbi:MAG: hypothetical protein ACRDS0_19045 [Pseudonocardiaceae bacterium]
MLLVDLGRLNTAVVPLAMRIMDESATAEEHYAFAERLEAMARRLQARAMRVGQVIDGEFAIASDGQENAGVGTVPYRDL